MGRACLGHSSQRYFIIINALVPNTHSEAGSVVIPLLQREI